MKPCGKSGRPGPVGRLLAFCRGGVPLAVLLLFLAPSTSGQCIAPSPFPFARPITQIEEPEFSVGTSLMYECRPGYKKKQFSIMCQANSAWTSAENMCTRKQCDTPKDPQNGIVHIPTDIQFGSSIDYTCNEGFRLIGSSSAMCILSDTTVVWDTEAPTCQQIPCEPPPAIANGEFSSTATEDFRYGMVVTYHCKSDKRGRKLFNLVGTTSLHCTTNDGNTGVWSGPPPQCIELNKCIPPHVENAIMVSENKSLFSLRDFVEFKCQPGFIMDGVNTVHCHNLNKWEPELPTCFKAKSCGAFLDHLPNGRVLFPLRAQLGAKVSFVCNEGFQLKGNSASYCILHGRDSVWNSSVPVCEQVICIIPKKDGIQEGLIRNYYFGNNVTLKCEDGYTLEGSSQSQCQSDASWFPPLAHCVAQVICIIPKKDGIQEGLIRNYYFGNNVTLKCEDGYTLEGSSQSQCQSDANWFPPLAHCVARSNRGLIAGIVFGVLFILFSIISCWLILKYKKRNTTDENCKEVSIHLNSQEDGCSHAPVLLTSQNSSSNSPVRNSLTQEASK